MKQNIHEVTFEELRLIRSSVLSKSDFTVEHRCLIPDESDLQGINLGFYEEGNLSSSMRGLPVKSAKELEENLDYRECGNLGLTYPGIVFGKACTYPEGRGKGRMRELYFAMVEKAKTAGFHFIALTTKPSNPLNEFLLEQGFEKKINPEGWHRFGYQSHGPTFIFLKELRCQSQ